MQRLLQSSSDFFKPHFPNLAVSTMKDLYSLSTHQPIGLTRFDAIVVVIIGTVLTLIAIPNRSSSFAPQGEQRLHHDPIQDAHWLAPSSIQPGHQTEIRSLAPDSLLGEESVNPPQVLMASSNNTHIAQWSYYSPDMGTGTRVTKDILGL